MFNWLPRPRLSPLLNATPRKMSTTKPQRFLATRARVRFPVPAPKRFNSEIVGICRHLERDHIAREFSRRFQGNFAFTHPRKAHRRITHLRFGGKSQKEGAQALAPTSYATLAMAAANWAMWHASKGPERERMSRTLEDTAFTVRTAESELIEEAGGQSGSHPVTAIVPVGVAP